MLRLTIAIALLAISQIALAQTAAEQLQKGIFAEQTQGSLDEAITIYRQLANSGLPQRDIAAQAQYRLALALLQKGDMAGAAGEFERLARSYADYQNLISSLAARASHAGMPAPAALSSFQTFLPTGSPPQPPFEKGAYVSASGKVVQVMWVNPISYVTIDAGAGLFYSFATTSPNSLMRLGMNRTSLQIDSTVSITGYLAADGRKRPFTIDSATGQKIEGDAIVAQAETIVRVEDGKMIFDREKLSPGMPLPAENK